MIITWQGFGNGSPHSVLRVGFITDQSDAAPSVALGDGRQFTGAAVTGIDWQTPNLDAAGFVEVTGLRPGRVYDAIITVGSESAPITLRPAPDRAPYKAAFMSCLSNTRRHTVPDLINAAAPAFVHIAGDFPYGDEADPISSDGVVPDAPSINRTAGHVLLVSHARVRNQSWMRELLTRQPVTYMPDDHEYIGRNFDHGLSKGNGGRGGDLSTMASVDELPDEWLRGVQVNNVMQATNPPAANASAERPGNIENNHSDPGSLDPDVYYPVKYWSMRIGPGTWICLDGKTYRDLISATDNASKTLLGANQKAWLKDQLLNKSTPFAVILCNKKFMAGGYLQDDGFENCTTERDELISYIDDNSITGVAWLTGDDHIPQVELGWQSLADAPEFVETAHTNNVISINACPSGVGVSAFPDRTMDDFFTYGTYTRLVFPEAHNVYCLVDVESEETLRFDMIDQGGRIIWRGYLDAGKSSIRYPVQQAAIA